MKTLWFKDCYVAPILAGKKTDTIRRESDRLPNVGEIVAFAVGPRTPFATAKIKERQIIDSAKLSVQRRIEVLGIYQGYKGKLIRLIFQTASA